MAKHKFEHRDEGQGQGSLVPDSASLDHHLSEEVVLKIKNLAESLRPATAAICSAGDDDCVAAIFLAQNERVSGFLCGPRASIIANLRSSGVVTYVIEPATGVLSSLLSFWLSALPKKSHGAAVQRAAALANGAITSVDVEFNGLGHRIDGGGDSATRPTKGRKPFWMPAPVSRPVLADGPEATDGPDPDAVESESDA